MLFRRLCSSKLKKFHKIAQIGWIENARHGNAVGIGNTLDLLGIEENNLPIPNAAEWELKTQRVKTNAKTTLFHTEPSPRAVKFVPRLLLPYYGWKHKEAGIKYPETEMSFRQTFGGKHTSRGFSLQIDRTNKKVVVSFDYCKVSQEHGEWLQQIGSNRGLLELDPQPYWGFDDLACKAGTKLLNCFYVQAEVKRKAGKEFYKYNNILMLQKFSFNKFLQEIENDNVLADFDARTGHNHGTKFRLRKNCFPTLYENATRIM